MPIVTGGLGLPSVGSIVASGLGGPASQIELVLVTGGKLRVTFLERGILAEFSDRRLLIGINTMGMEAQILERAIDAAVRDREMEDLAEDREMVTAATEVTTFETD